MRRKHLLVLAVGAALTVAVFAAAGLDPKPVTVGDFALKVSRALGYSYPDAKSAVEALRAAGVDLGRKDLNARVTEGEAVRILTGMGIRVVTGNPANELSPGKFEGLISSVALTGVESPGIEVEPPFQCRELKPHECKLCCLAAVPPGFLPEKNPDGICKVFCRTGFFPPSASEPSP